MYERVYDCANTDEEEYNLKRLLRKILSVVMVLILLIGAVTITAYAEDKNELSIMFIHDSHDYLYPTTTIENGAMIEHGGAARLAAVIKENADENTIFLDGGDFSMGTLYQAAYSTDAYELRNLGICGCDVTTFGNHEFDYGAKGAAQMLRAAVASGDKLPQIVQSNIDLSGKLTEEQADFKKACEEYGVKENTILECAGHKIGIFGLVGISCIACIQTDLDYVNYIKSAKEQVKKLREKGCDIIIALSHSGTDGDGKNGEDIDLAKKVSGIDVIISGHTHTVYETPIRIKDTLIVSCGEYLKNVGKLTVSLENGKIQTKDYQLIPLNSSVKEDEETKARFEKYKENINHTYLKDSEPFDKVIAHSNFDFIGLDEMYNTHQEYPLGDLIADSYIYEAEKNGITDIDVALVGLGTVRSSFKKGDITVADAFEVCSLGVGADGSAGHPLVAAYIRGRDLKLLVELDASLGELVSSIKMSYSGLNYTFNTKRLILNRVTESGLDRGTGQLEKIENNKLYKVVANMYALNMLDMVNGLTKGIISIAPRDKDGNKVTDFYSISLKDKSGNEIKEWVAFRDYLKSFEVGSSGYPEIPASYAAAQNRKVKISHGVWEDIDFGNLAIKFVPVIKAFANLVFSFTVTFAKFLINLSKA